MHRMNRTDVLLNSLESKWNEARGLDRRMFFYTCYREALKEHNSRKSLLERIMDKARSLYVCA